MERVHICGLGGIGASGVARLLHELGYSVRGTDQRQSQLSRELELLGLELAYETRPDWVANADFVLTPSLFPVDHPELVAARRAGIPILGRSEVLAKLSQAHASTSCLCMGTLSRGLLTRMLAASVDGSGYCAGAATRDGQPNAKWGSPFFIDIDERDFIGHEEDLEAFQNADILVSDWAKEHDNYYPESTTLEAFLAKMPNKGRRVFPDPSQNQSDDKLRIICQSDGQQWQENFEICPSSEGYCLKSGALNLMLQPISGTRADLSAMAVALSWLKMTQRGDAKSPEHLLAFSYDPQHWPIAYFERLPMTKHHLEVRMHPVGVRTAITAARELRGGPLYLAIKPYASTLRAYEPKVWAEIFSQVAEIIVILPPYEGCTELEIVEFVNYLCQFGHHCRSMTLEELHAQAKTTDHWLFIGAPDIVKGFI